MVSRFGNVMSVKAAWLMAFIMVAARRTGHGSSAIGPTHDAEELARRTVAQLDTLDRHAGVEDLEDRG